MNEIMVSINCATFNHEDFIEEALDSFLNQKTNFKYEILIHDDASTDNTAAIIKEYQKRYPDIIKPILREENQYSQGKKVSLFNDYRAEGKYIAMCEGDDYWSDSNKLQKQFDFMEKNSEYSLTLHNAMKLNNQTKEDIGPVRPLNDVQKDYTTDEIILAGGDYFPTASMFYRTKFTEKYPDFYLTAPTGDVARLIYFSLCGKVNYDNAVMSVYRVNNPDSWVGQNSSVDKKVKWLSGSIEMYEEINSYTKGLYNTSLNYRIAEREFNLLLLKKDFQTIKQEKYNEVYRNLPMKKKVSLFLHQYFSPIMNLYHKTRGFIQK